MDSVISLTNRDVLKIHPEIDLSFVHTGAKITGYNRNLFSEYAQDGDKVYQALIGGELLKVYHDESALKRMGFTHLSTKQKQQLKLPK